MLCFQTEILEHLKLRFSENDLQACMVMLRDITDSGRVDHTIRSDQKINHLYSERRESGEGQQPPEFHPKFLSHLFWPTLRDETFVVPPEIVTMQRRYESGFEALKQSRKLTWLNALGQVKVFLDLDDRVVQEDVTTWQAAVIYAFQDSSQTIGKPVTRAVGDLVTKLQMDESMVRNALTLWVGKRVLREDQKDVYTVLERVDDTTLGKESAEAAVAAAAESEAVASAPAIKSTDVTTVEKMHMFWQFIQGMLTNRGAMPLQGIITMLQFAVPGGFPYSSEELREFLGHMIDEDKLEIAAGKYKIKA
jgi:anaphase-promoting complex subunit 2